MFCSDRRFGLFPEGFQFVDAAALQIPFQGGFNAREAVEEALIRAGKAFFGFDLAPTGHIHQGEQQIAQFLLGMPFVAAGHRLLEFVNPKSTTSGVWEQPHRVLSWRDAHRSP